jgi:hypothetical protein
MKTENYIILSLILLSLLGAAMNYNMVLVDTQAYVPSVYFLQDKPLWDEDMDRVLLSYAFKRPVEIAIASFVEPFVGVRQAYAMINVLLYMITSIITYYYMKRLFANQKNGETIAYIAALLFTMSLPLIIYASRVLVDVAGYLALIIGLWIIDMRLEKEHITWKDHLTISIMIGFFMLVRDAVVILYPYYALKYLLRNGINIEYIKKKGVDLWPLIFTLLPQWMFITYFNVGSILAGKGVMITAGKYSLLGWIKFIIVHAAAFHIAWIFAMITFVLDKDKKRRFFYTVYLISSFTYLIGIQLVALTSPRFSMVLFPAVLAAAAYGIVKSATKTAIFFEKKISPTTIIFSICLIYILISFLGAWLYPEHGLITEDAGGDVVINAVINEIKIKMGALL